MAPDPEYPSGPVTPAELVGLRPGVDVPALQELVDAVPQIRGLMLAILRDSRDPDSVYDALDEMCRREGVPPAPRPPPEPVTEPKWIKSSGPNGLTLLSEPHYDYQIDFGGDKRLQRLFDRARGFRQSDA